MRPSWDSNFWTLDLQSDLQPNALRNLAHTHLAQKVSIKTPISLFLLPQNQDVTTITICNLNMFPDIKYNCSKCTKYASQEKVTWVVTFFEVIITCFFSLLLTGMIVSTSYETTIAKFWKCIRLPDAKAKPDPEVIKLFPYSTLTAEHEIFSVNKYENANNRKKFCAELFLARNNLQFLVIWD